MFKTIHKLFTQIAAQRQKSWRNSKGVTPNGGAK